jgi:hypothetical protein
MNGKAKTKSVSVAAPRSPSSASSPPLSSSPSPSLSSSSLSSSSSSIINAVVTRPSDRLLQVHVQDDKRGGGKRSLVNALPNAIDFITRHMLAPPRTLEEKHPDASGTGSSVAASPSMPPRNNRVLICGTDGGVVAICVACAVLVSSYDHRRMLRRESGMRRLSGTGGAAKDAVRDTMSWLQTIAPSVYPSRQLIKQITKFFAR